LSETDSFIDEVTEEVRRDKLFAIFRKYGWIPITLVVLVVAGAGWNEWRKAQDQAAAQAFGDGVLQALAKPAAPAQAVALEAVKANNAQTRIFLDLLVAAAKAEADDPKAALALLDKVAGNPAAPQTFRQLATLKAVILRGADQDRKTRLAILDRLAKPGKPFRLAALEQKALVLYEYGDNKAAIAVLKTILDEPATTQALLQRAQQLIVAMGGTLDNATSSAASGSNG